jgi:phosphoribosylglycinamide formyltransferase 1
MRHVLLTENTFHASYLVTRWRETFADDPGRIVLRERPLPTELRRARDRFHTAHAGERRLDADAWAEFDRLYPDASPTDLAMITEFGVPALSVSAGPDLESLGTQLNSAEAENWLDRQAGQKPLLFVFLDKILAPWWMSRLDGNIVNAHSAVLPNARGMFAIEQVAAGGDAERFALAAGASVHYVDEGVDTGPVIGTRALSGPWRFDSIWACKAHCFDTAFDLLIETVAEVLRTGEMPPRGVPQPDTPGWPDFRRRDFDDQRRRRAEEGYLRMKDRRSTALTTGNRF